MAINEVGHDSASSLPVWYRKKTHRLDFKRTQCKTSNGENISFSVRFLFLFLAKTPTEIPSLKMQTVFFLFCRRRRRVELSRFRSTALTYTSLFCTGKMADACLVCINKRHQAVESPSYVHRSFAN